MIALDALAALFFVAVFFVLLDVRARLTRLPNAVRAVVQEDRERTATEITEATAARVGQAVLSLSTYVERYAQGLRDQLAAMETRARVAEIRSGETAEALRSARVLTARLRQAVDRALALAPADERETAPGPKPAPAVPPQDTSDSGDEPTVAGGDRSAILRMPAFQPAREERGS